MREGEEKNQQGLDILWQVQEKGLVTLRSWRTVPSRSLVDFQNMRVCVHNLARRVCIDELQPRRMGSE